jgi:hypothetical protein
MQAYHPSSDEQRRFLEDNLTDLRKINKFLAEVTVMREEIIQNIISALQHNHEGQKTYEYDLWKIEIKTPSIYSLNKKLYESGDIKLPDKFNPIRESKSYSVDKNLCEQYKQSAPNDVKLALVELIEKKPGKPSVVIKERI